MSQIILLDNVNCRISLTGWHFRSFYISIICRCKFFLLDALEKTTLSFSSFEQDCKYQTFLKNILYSNSKYFSKQLSLNVDPRRRINPNTDQNCFTQHLYCRFGTFFMKKQVNLFVKKGRNSQGSRYKLSDITLTQLRKMSMRKMFLWRGRIFLLFGILLRFLTIQVCQEVCEPLIETITNGCNSCFMVYGQTGSGKWSHYYYYGISLYIASLIWSSVSSQSHYSFNRIIDIVAILINQGGVAVITFFNSKILFDSAIFVGV